MKKITLLFCLCLILQQSFAFGGRNKIIEKNRTTALLPPANDECATATALVMNAGQACTFNTLAAFTAATTSSEPNACAAPTTADIWFQFEAASASHSISLSNFSGTPQPVVLALYEGSDCSTMTQLYCTENNVINANGLTIGETYKLRAYFNLASPGLASSFSVCVNTPPPPSSSNPAECVVNTVNYSFEAPPPTATIYPIFTNHNTVQGWRTTASDEMMEFWPVPNYENVPAYEGEQFIELNANLVSAVYQDYNTPQTTVFTFGFAHRGRQGTDTCELRAGPPEGPYVTVATATTGNTSWSYYTGTYTVPAGQPITRFLLQSVSSVGGVSVGNYLDAITFTANNGIITDNPYYPNCGESTIQVEAAGIGTWTAHPDNPSATIIADPSANETEITGLTEPGIYYFDWTTEYCQSTLEVFSLGPGAPSPVVENVVYCHGQAAVPLTAGTLPDHTVTWVPSGPGGTAPTPDTSVVGTTIYYVIQTTPGGCDSVSSAIQVTVNSTGASVTDFSLPETACIGGDNIFPEMAEGYTAGGEFTANDPALAIDPVTGEIDLAASAEGTYMVTYSVVEDPANCIMNSESSSMPIEIIAPPAVADAVVTAQPDCETPTGTITVNSPLGADLIYSINNGDNWQAEAIFTGVAPGTYDIMVQNAAGCTSVFSSVTIDPAPPTPPFPGIDAQSPGCNETTGTITITSPIGDGYLYSINGGDFQEETEFIVDPGTYTVTVQNAEGCEISTLPFVINETPENPTVADVEVTQPECNPTGSIVVTAPTGEGYSYSIDGETFQSNAGFGSLTPGDYVITVQNASGCLSVTDAITINPPFEVPPFPNIDIEPAYCDDPDATVTIMSPLGAEYEYSIDGTDFQVSNIFSTVNPGAYTITVRNVNTGCESGNIPVYIGSAGGLPDVADFTVTPPSCGQPNATITIDSPIEDGLTYSINDSNFQSSPVFNNVPPGTYVITVKNPSQCKSYTASFTINPGPASPDAPVATIVNPTCTVATGTVTVESPAGAGYTYSLDGGTFQASPVFANVSSGTHTITVQNEDGCTASANVTVAPQPVSPPVATVDVVSPDCNETSGSLTITAPIGGGVSYSLDGGNTVQYTTVFDDLAPGDYIITVINNGGCISETLPLTIDTPPVPEYPGVITADENFICIDATLQLDNDVTGGLWATSNSGIATIDADGLLTPVAPGVITVTYEVPSPCPAIAEFEVTVYALPNPQLEDANVCLDIETDEYTPVILDSGLSEGYSFEWSKDGVQLADATGAITVTEPGEYTVVATDDVSGCIGSATATIGESSIAVVHAEVGADFNLLQSINVVVTGGSGDYEFRLDDGPFQDQPYFANIHQGEYTITVRDKNGCGQTELQVYALNYPRFFSPNGDGEREVWNIDGLTGQPGAVIYIFDRYGKLVGSALPGLAGWDGTYEGAPLPATDYWFQIRYTSSDGTQKEYKAHFSLLR